MSRIVLSRRAERDLRRIGRGEALARLREALEGLADGEASLDVKPLSGSAPWHRLRVGDYRDPGLLTNPDPSLPTVRSGRRVSQSTDRASRRVDGGDRCQASRAMWWAGVPSH
jgi:hypothetical protein